MKHVLMALGVTILGAASLLSPLAASASETQSNDLHDKTVVLVHGAFADGSSWSKVIPLLEARGLHVVAVQNPLSSLEDDAAATKHAIEQAPGQVVLVGHSWGGVVITQAGNDKKVSALVYVAAFAPASGQSISDMLQGLPAPAWASQLQKDSGNFLTLPAALVHSDFAQDVTPQEADLIAVTQGPWAARCQTDKVSEAAWKTRPSWFVVTEKDHMIAPALQEKMATAIGAHVVRTNASHVAMVSQPRVVADAIIQAAEQAR